MKILFLDFDGVIRVPVATAAAELGPDDFDFCPDRIARLAGICRDTGTRVVVSSDWRHLSNRPEIENHLGPLAAYLHDDWATGIHGHRWNEVLRWLAGHPETTSFVILDDFVPHFHESPDWMLARFVACTNRHGFVPELADRVLRKLALPFDLRAA